MSDPDRNAEAEPSEASESAVSSERRGADDDASATLQVAEASLHAVARASEPPTSGARKRSSIRPAPADWRPNARAVSNPPRPMVVVYSGDRERPDRWWDETPALADSLSVEADTPVPPDPALSARDLRPPPVARITEDSSASDDDLPSVQQFSTIIPPAGNAADTSETEAPVALSSAARALPLSLQGAMRVSEPPRLSDADLRSIKRERASLVRRAAVIVVGAFLSAYFVTQRVAFRKNEAARALAEKASQHVGAPSTPNVTEVPQPLPNAAEGPPAPASAFEAPVPPPSVAEAGQPPASAAEAPPPAESAEEPSEPAPPAAKASRTVVIEVVPWDAKVLLAGVAQPGPPFVVTIPQGKRIAFEVARRGFIPRRVVVDGSEPKLSVGLIRPRGARVEVAPPPAARPAESDAEDGPKDSRLRVRSGL